MADRTKESTLISNNISSSFNSNATLMFLHGISSEEDALDKDIKKLTGQIEHTKQTLLQEKHAKIMLSVDCEYLEGTKKHEKLDSLLGEIQEAKKLQDQLKKDRAELEMERERNALEAVRSTNPKLYNLKKRLFETREHCHQKKFQLEAIEEERIKLSRDYTSLIQNLKAEEGLKSKITQLEAAVEEKDRSLKEVRELYTRLHTELEDYEADLQTRKNVSKLLEAYQSMNLLLNESRKEVNVLKNKLRELQDEIVNTSKVESVSENGSENVRTEIRRLERTVLEMDKEYNEKARRKKKIEAEHREVMKKLEQIKKYAKPRPEPPKQLGSSNKGKSPVLGTPNSGLAAYRVSLSPKQMEMSKSPGMLSRKSRATTSRKPKLTSEQEAVLKTINEIEKNKGSMHALSTLQSYGKNDQSLPSKIIQLNRALLQKPANKS